MMSATLTLNCLRRGLKTVGLSLLVGGLTWAEASAQVESATAEGIEVSLSDDRATATLSFPEVTSARTVYLAYGRSDGGCEISKWDHVDKFADVVAGDASCTAFLPDAARKTGVRMRFLMDRADFTSASYVQQNDLLGLWDAIDCAATAAGWSDLKGGAPLVWYGNADFDAKSVKMDGKTALTNVVAGLKTALASKSFTIQMMIHAEKVSELANYQCFFRLGGTSNRSLLLDARYQTDSGSCQHGHYTFGGLQYRESSYAGRSTIVAQNDFFGQDVLVTVTTDSSGAHLWVNDAVEPLHTTVGGSSGPAEDAVSIFSSDSTASSYPGKIYGIRLYKRTLTADEIRANCRVDFARYAERAARCSKLIAIGYDFTADIATDWSKASFVFENSDKVRELYLVYGPTDGGNTPAKWAHCVKLTDIPADTRTLADVALPAGIADSAENRYLRFLVNSKLDTYDYVQEDLMAMWDARENAGRGTHDAAATSWKDLVGGNDLMPDKITLFSGENGIALTNNNAFAGSVANLANTLERSGLTVQMMMKPLNPKTQYLGAFQIGPGGTERSLMLDARKQSDPGAVQKDWYSFGGLQFRESTWTLQSTIMTENYYYGTNLLVTVTVDGKGANLWFDGALEPAYTTGGGTKETTQNTIQFGRSSTADKGQYYPMILYGARLYRRALTAAEIARNNAVDHERVEGVFMAMSPRFLLPAHPFAVTVERGKYLNATFTPSQRPRKLVFAWDAADRGETLADWANRADLATVAAGAWKLENVPLPADRDRGAVAGRFFLEADYVQEGLYAQWDAEDNVGWGRHETKPAAWLDLVDGKTLKPVKASAFDDASVLLAGDNYFQGEVSGVSQFFRNRSFTVQLACRPGDFVAYSAALYFGKDTTERTMALDQRHEKSVQSTQYTFGALQYLENSWSGRSCIEERNTYFGQDVLATVTTDSSGAHLWFDNASSAFFTTVGGSLVPATDLFYLGFYPGNNPYKMTVYGVRIYNRTLTADEIATNWSVDNGRFFGGTPKYEVSEAQDVRRPGFSLSVR